MNNLLVFDYKDSEVRAVLLEDGPWWVLKDVCGALGIGDHRAWAYRLAGEKKTVVLKEGRCNPNKIAVSEAGLRAVIDRCGRPEAEAFGDWADRVMLPAVRAGAQSMAKNENTEGEDNLSTECETNGLRVFNYEGNEVRTVVLDGEVWWVAKDICDVFGETNRNRAMQALDEDEKGYTQMTTPRGEQQLAIVNEPGLYSLLFAMQPSKARGVSEEYIAAREEKLGKFRRWVTHEVLPSIHRHGAYLTPEAIEKAILNPDFIIQLAGKLKEEQGVSAALRLQIEEAQPKVDFANAVMESDTTILVRELAKFLQSNGINIGQNRLFEWLRRNGFLIKAKGQDYNAPTQRAMDMGLFRYEESVEDLPEGGRIVKRTPKVTGRGQEYFLNRFLAARKSANPNENELEADENQD